MGKNIVYYQILDFAEVENFCKNNNLETPKRVFNGLDYYKSSISVAETLYNRFPYSVLGYCKELAVSF